MPTYQYACTSCGERLEAVQTFTDDPLTECPTCHGVLRKVFSPVGVVFKGSGFYKTDSRKSAKSSTSTSTSTSSSDESAGGGTSTESTKPADNKPAAPAPAADRPAGGKPSSGDRVA